MMTIEGIVKIFQDPNGVFIGWVHYVVFDALVGRTITLDSGERGAKLTTRIYMLSPALS
jgi:hypothetical protein